MTSHGSPYGQFRRALDAGQATKAWALAAELPRISLADALELCLLLADARHERYEAAARRWLQRFATESKASLHEILIAGSALAELGLRPRSEVARDTLEQLVGAGATG